MSRRHSPRILELVNRLQIPRSSTEKSKMKSYVVLRRADYEAGEEAQYTVQDNPERRLPVVLHAMNRGIAFVRRALYNK